MRLVLSLFALLPVSVVAEVPVSVAAPGIVAPPAPEAHAGMPQGRVPCRDTIHQVREERGLPRLDSDSRANHEPVMIAAVDHRINGCSVLVMHGNTSDVRPLPALPNGAPRLERLAAR